MIVISGTGQQSKHKFQIGAVGIAKEIDQCAEQFEAFGECVAQAVIKLFGK
ncbi:MAG: hypothetical protein ACI4D7_08620 [Lachnospiraceae bacterium]